MTGTAVIVGVLDDGASKQGVKAGPVGAALHADTDARHVPILERRR